MITDLLEAAELASRCFHDGSDKTKLNLRECMADLRCAIEQEKKRRAQSETTTLTRPTQPKG